jgi:rare lipoprotein A
MGRYSPAVLSLALLSFACAGSLPRFTGSSSSLGPPELEGEASYYGEEFEGRTTANGETYVPTALTAAHRSLPFGTIVRVTNLENGREVVVRINDRGPWKASRILDLSLAAAKDLGMVGSGTARVRLEILPAKELP